MRPNVDCFIMECEQRLDDVSLSEVVDSVASLDVMNSFLVSEISYFSNKWITLRL